MASSMGMDDAEDLVDSDDYYAWLGLSKNASSGEINNAFRRLSRIYHPDKHATDPGRQEKAQSLFTKIKKAHEILSDPQKKAIFDTMGLKGLEADGWEVVTRTKTAQEIIQEYERIMQEQEERRLDQQTNPKGSIVVGIDATDLFDKYDSLDDPEYSSAFPHIEVTDMSLTQSVECPLTVKDTGVLSGRLSSRNGRGHGTFSVAGRRVLSTNGWAEVEAGVGDGASLSVRGFKTLWRRSFGTMSGTIQFSPHGHIGVIRPSLSTMVATQLDKNIQGRLTWNWGLTSAMSAMLVYNTEKHHLALGLQLGMPSTYASLNYSRKFVESETKVRGMVRVGTTIGIMAEYGCEKKITKFSHLGVSLSFGVPMGVTLKVKLNRGNHSVIVPIHLADEIIPSAMFYGTVVPIVTFFAVKVLIVEPFLKDRENKELQKKKEANIQRMSEKQREAETALELMQEMVQRVVEIETRKGGLVIKKALYGKLEGKEVKENECIDVTLPLQALVSESKLSIPEGTKLNELPGFYDPCVGENKQLSITYEFRRQLHTVIAKDTERLLLPNREHLAENNSTESSSSSR